MIPFFSARPIIDLSNSHSRSFFILGFLFLVRFPLVSPPCSASALSRQGLLAPASLLMSSATFSSRSASFCTYSSSSPANPGLVATIFFALGSRTEAEGGSAEDLHFRTPSMSGRLDARGDGDFCVASFIVPPLFWTDRLLHKKKKTRENRLSSTYLPFLVVSYIHKYKPANLLSRAAPICLSDQHAKPPPHPIAYISTRACLGCEADQPKPKSRQQERLGAPDPPNTAAHASKRRDENESKTQRKRTQPTKQKPRVDDHESTTFATRREREKKKKKEKTVSVK